MFKKNYLSSMVLISLLFCSKQFLNRCILKNNDLTDTIILSAIGFNNFFQVCYAPL